MNREARMVERERLLAVLGGWLEYERVPSPPGVVEFDIADPARPKPCIVGVVTLMTTGVVSLELHSLSPEQTIAVLIALKAHS